MDSPITNNLKYLIYDFQNNTSKKLLLLSKQNNLTLLSLLPTRQMKYCQVHKVTASAVKLEGCKIEPALANAEPSDKFQFVRCGYFVKDTKNENTFNRIVGLKDSFPKQK